MMRTMQVEMKTRSRTGTIATDDELGTPPGKRRGLAAILSARVVPRQTERVHVTLGRILPANLPRRRCHHSLLAQFDLDKNR